MQPHEIKKFVIFAHLLLVLDTSMFYTVQLMTNIQEISQHHQQAIVTFVLLASRKILEKCELQYESKTAFELSTLGGANKLRTQRLR